MQSCIYAFCKTKAMDQNTYLQKRVQDQQQWYSDKSSWNQKRFRTFKTIVIILSVSIPLATGYVEQGGLALRIGIGLAGALIAILEGISTFNKYQEKWLEYRQAAEFLKREQLLFETKSGPYKDPKVADIFHTLVERVENFTAEENQRWTSYMKESSGKTQAPGSSGPE